MISEKGKFVFIHPPKTAGSSICFALKDYGTGLSFSEDTGNAIFDGSITIRKHANVQLIKERLGSDWSEYKKFSVVRNPWDRYVSVYFWLKHLNHEQVEGLDFRDFILGRSRLNSCYEYCQINDELVVDKVLRYENLEEEFGALCDEWSLVATPLTQCNQINRPHYSHFYNKETRDMVAERMKTDIEFFNYSF